MACGEEARTQKAGDGREKGGREKKRKQSRGSTAHTSGDINQPLDCATLIYRRHWTRLLGVSFSLSFGRITCVCATFASRKHTYIRSCKYRLVYAMHIGVWVIRVLTVNRSYNIAANKRRLSTGANQRHLLRVCSGSSANEQFIR